MKLLINPTSPFARLARIALLESGCSPEIVVVDPWADASVLREPNPAARVPTLILDDGRVLTESLLIVQWLTASGAGQPLLGQDSVGVLSRTGLIFGVIEAAAITMITRRVTAPVLFDDTPVGLRRRRTIVEGLERLENLAAEGTFEAGAAVRLDQIALGVAVDYLRFRFGTAAWMIEIPHLWAIADALGSRPAFASTVPR